MGKNGCVFAVRRVVYGMVITLTYSIVNGLNILALSICQSLMVTGINPERHPMVKNMELIMVVARQVVAVVIIKEETCQLRCVLLCLSLSSHSKILIKTWTLFTSCQIFISLCII